MPNAEEATGGSWPNSVDSLSLRMCIPRHRSALSVLGRPAPSESLFEVMSRVFCREEKFPTELSSHSRKRPPSRRPPQLLQLQAPNGSISASRAMNLALIVPLFLQLTYGRAKLNATMVARNRT